MKTLSYLGILVLLHIPSWGGIASSAGPETAISECDTSFLSKDPGLNWAADPFLKKPGFAVKETELDDLKLEAVIWDRESPRAVVNGMGVSRGDRVHGKKVIKIGENYVVLEQEDSLMELTLPLKSNSGGGDPLISIEEVSK